MSANRETIAKALDIPADQVKCTNCARHSKFINHVLWCDGWNSNTWADWFCSFFEKGEEDA